MLAPHLLGKEGRVRTDLLCEHAPLEFGEVLHRPDVVSPACAFLTADRLRVEHLGDAPRDFFVLELDPAFGEVRLFGGGVFATQIRAFGVYAAVRLQDFCEENCSNLLAGGILCRRRRACS
jgi:hypothetical protein